MALTTYSDLTTSLRAWSQRGTALDSYLADFIAIAEKRITRDLKPREFEEEAPLTMAPASRYVALPADFQTPVALWLTAFTPRQVLTQVLPELLPVDTGTSGYPTYWAIDGANIAFDVLADSAHTLAFRYIKNDALSGSNTTNYLLSKYPDLLLFGALVESFTYQADRDSSATYEVRYQAALQEARSAEARNKAPAILATEVATVGAFDIQRGY